MLMKIRYRLIRRGERGKQFYCVDSETGQRLSLQTNQSRRTLTNVYRVSV
jgi:hypothetical protein